MKIFYSFLGLLIFYFSCPAFAATLGKKETAYDYFNKGTELEELCVYGEAIKAYSQAIKLDPSYGEAYFRRGKTRGSQNPTDCVEAILDISKTIELDPTNAEAYYERGLLNAFAINNEQAKSDMETASRLGHKEAKRWLNPKEDEGIRYVDLKQYTSGKTEPLVYFDFDRSDIKPENYQVLNDIGTALKGDIAGIIVFVAGHADIIGTKDYNDRLSLKRAEAVKKFLMEKYNLPPQHIITKAFGNTQPVAANDTEEGRSQNRRVELIGVEGS